VEDQVVPQFVQLLEIGGDGLGAHARRMKR
jgi:hypothetical protein